MNRWTKFFFKIAEDYAGQSHDPSTKVGCIVSQGKRQVSQGYNGLPPNMSDDLEILNNRELRLSMTLHAEQNALLWCNRRDLEGATVYVTAPPCALCCAFMLACSIGKVCYLEASEEFMERWGDNVEFGLDKLRKADIPVLSFKREELE